MPARQRLIDAAHYRAEMLSILYGHLPARQLLARLVGREFAGRLALVSSFGAESAVLLHMIARIDPATPVIFLDTGKLFDATLAYRDRLVATGSARSTRPAASGAGTRIAVALSEKSSRSAEIVPSHGHRPQMVQGVGPKAGLALIRQDLLEGVHRLIESLKRHQGLTALEYGLHPVGTFVEVFDQTVVRAQCLFVIPLSLQRKTPFE